jgi:hypothetical protein
MAIVYYDYVSGNDGTGNGTFGNPYKSLNKATTGLAGGDEVRAAVTPQTALSGTLTFTNGSLSVNTSVDLTAVLQQNDIIKHGAANEAWWMVDSLTSSVITLKYKYWGTDGAGKTGYKIRPAVVSVTDVSTVSGTSELSRLKISGGWTLGSQTKTGITAITSGSIIPFNCSGAKYLEVSDFYFSSTSSPFKIGPYSYVHDIFWGGTDPYCSFRSIIENLIGAGFYNWALDLSSAGDPFSIDDMANSAKGHTTLKNIWIYSSDHGILQNGNHIYYDNLNMFYLKTSFIDFNQSMDCYIKNSMFDTLWGTPAGDGFGAFCADSPQTCAIFYNCDFKNIETIGLIFEWWEPYTIDLFRFYECRITNCLSYLPVIPHDNDDDYNSEFYSIFHTKTGESFRTYKDGGKIELTATGSISGKCLKVTPVLPYHPIQDKIGVYKITDLGTNIETSVYLKKDESFDGKVYLFCTVNGRFMEIPQQVTLTTDYAKYALTVDASDLVENEYIDFYIEIFGGAGNVFIDNISIDQEA